MYHNNKDNSIKTPIIARYNTPRWDTDREKREGIFCLFIIIMWVSDTCRDIWKCEIFVSTFRVPCVFSRLPAMYLRKYLPASRLPVLGQLSLQISPGPRLVRDQPGQVGWKLFVGPRPGDAGGGVASRLGNDQVTTCSGERCRQPRYGDG